MNYRVVCYILSIILFFFSLSFLTMVPLAIGFGEKGALIAALESLGIGMAVSLALYGIGYNERKASLFRRESLAVVGTSWLLVAGLGALPFALGQMLPTYTDAYFEAMSGLTTTGSTVLRDIESQDKALLFWRSFLHFVGGLGIVVFFVAILPVLGVGGKSLFRQEVPGPTPEGLTPRIKDTAIGLCRVYIALNAIEFVVLMTCGMGWYDALNHAFATMATGGFSPSNTSVAAYSALIQWVIIVFMFLAGTNFSLHLQAVRGNWRAYFRDLEFRVYTGVILLSALLFTIVLYSHQTEAVSHPGELNFRDSLFNVVAIKTTTGFGTVDFNLWPVGLQVMLVALMFMGGMAGSTAGGLKVVRIIILLKSAIYLLRKEVNPRRVITVKLSNRPLQASIQSETFGFFFVYITVFLGGVMCLAFLMEEQDLISSATAVAATLNNIGPGLAAVGPTMNFADQGLAAKWLLSLLMVLGRLELYPILVLFAPRFWVPR